MEFELIEEGDTTAPFMSYARRRAAEKAERDPIVGDTVHYWDGVACRAGLVTQDDLDTIQLSFWMPGEISCRPVRQVRHDEGHGDSTWHWPCGGQ